MATKQKVMKVRKSKDDQLIITIPNNVNIGEGDFLSFTPRWENKVEIKKVVI